MTFEEACNIAKEEGKINEFSQEVKAAIVRLREGMPIPVTNYNDREMSTAFFRGLIEISGRSQFVLIY